MGDEEIMHGDMIASNKRQCDILRDRPKRS